MAGTSWERVIFAYVNSAVLKDRNKALRSYPSEGFLFGEGMNTDLFGVIPHNGSEF
jgi:hypothetical protein